MNKKILYQIAGQLNDSSITDNIKNISLIIIAIVGILLLAYLLLFTVPSYMSTEHLTNVTSNVTPNTTPNATPNATPNVTPLTHQEETPKREIQTTYNKYDEITKPSSVSQPYGYIGRDFVCFRNKMKDHNFMKKRSGCMACQVDQSENKHHNYHGTNTNVIATCVYADQKDPNDPDVWTYEECKQRCSAEKYKNLV